MGSSFFGGILFAVVVVVVVIVVIKGWVGSSSAQKEIDKKSRESLARIQQNPEERVEIIKKYKARSRVPTGDHDLCEELANEYGLKKLTMLFILMQDGIFKDLWGAKRNDIEDKIGRLPRLLRFNSSEYVIGCTGRTGLAIDGKKGRICLLQHDGESVSTKIVPINDILSVELFENGKSKQKVVPSTKVGSAIIGGLLLGGAGAIVGAIAGKGESVTTSESKQIQLQIVIEDEKAPLFDIVFLDHNSSQSSLSFDQAKLNARHWYAVLEILLKKFKEDSQAGEHNTTSENDRNDAPSKQATRKKVGVKVRVAKSKTIQESS